jgi:hypothetical protein
MIAQVKASSSDTLENLMMGNADNNVSAWTKDFAITVFRNGHVTIEVCNEFRTVATIRTTLADLLAVIDALKGVER